MKKKGTLCDMFLVVALLLNFTTLQEDLGSLSACGSLGNYPVCPLVSVAMGMAKVSYKHTTLVCNFARPSEVQTLLT